MHLRLFIKISGLYPWEPSLNCDAHGVTGRLISFTTGRLHVLPWGRLTQFVAQNTVSGEGLLKASLTWLCL